MQAVKALYKHGNIELLEPLEGVEEAELFIVVLDKNEKNSDVVQTFISREKNSEEEFKAIGLASYFEKDEDNDVDWEEVFDVKAR
ncbi:MAG: hypothetical protein Q9M11_02465 [Mariprofundaceae bacterium]|nr:hypothetical protein [Mariprofundaceae bacterium]